MTAGTIGFPAALSPADTLMMRADPLSDPLILAAPPTLSLPQLHAALAQAYGLAGSLEPLAGERDRSLMLTCEDGSHRLVKLAHPAEDVRITDFQTAALLHLEQADPTFPVPRLVRSLDGEVVQPFDCGEAGISQLRVLTFLPGEPAARRQVGREQNQALGRFVAQLDHALTTFAHPGQARRLLWDIRETGCLQQLLPLIDDADQHRLVTQVLQRFVLDVEPVLPMLPVQVIHNDLNPSNILVEGSDNRYTGVIDFGDMLCAPRVQEVATACSYLLESGAEPLAGPAAFIRGYAEILTLSDSEKQVIPAMMAMRMAITVAITNWRARRQPENATYILRNVPRALAGLAMLDGLDSQQSLCLLGLEGHPHV